MKISTQKGFILRILIIVIALLAVSHYLLQKKDAPQQSQNPPIQKVQTPPVTSPISPSPNLKACTQEAKQCPDGSYVGRREPNCEFAACPALKSSNSYPPPESRGTTDTGGVKAQ